MKGNVNNRTMFKMHILIDQSSFEVTGGDIQLALNNAFLLLAINNAIMSPKLPRPNTATLYF